MLNAHGLPSVVTRLSCCFAAACDAIPACSFMCWCTPGAQGIACDAEYMSDAIAPPRLMSGSSHLCQHSLDHVVGLLCRCTAMPTYFSWPRDTSLQALTASERLQRAAAPAAAAACYQQLVCSVAMQWALQVLTRREKLGSFTMHTHMCCQPWCRMLQPHMQQLQVSHHGEWLGGSPQQLVSRYELQPTAPGVQLGSLLPLT